MFIIFFCNLSDLKHCVKQATDKLLLCTVRQRTLLVASANISRTFKLSFMKDATKLKQVQTVIMKRKQQKSNDMGIMVLGQEV